MTTGPGLYRLAIDAGLLTAGAPFRVLQRGDRYFAEDGLTDLRLVSEGGRPVPYLLIHAQSPEREWIRGNVLSVAATKKSSGFEVDLGAANPVDMIRVQGLPAPHLKRLTLEGSGDRERWTMLVAEGTLFDLPDEQLRQNTLSFAPGPYRYFRVTWNDANSGRVPNPSAVAARRDSIAPPPVAATLNASIERRPSEPGMSRYRVRLPGAKLPIVAVDLDVGLGVAGGHVYRRAVVSESRFAGLEAAPVELGRAMLSRVVRDGLTASALRVPIAVPTETELELTIDDGANEPLDLRAVSVVLAELPWIYFEAPAGALKALSGDLTLPRPQYDLEAVRSSVDLTKVAEAKWGDGGTTRTSRVANPPSGLAPSAGAVLDPDVFRYSRTLQSSPEAGDNAIGLFALPLDAHALAHSRGSGRRFADVRLLNGSNQQIPYVLERRNEPLSIDLPVRPASNVQAQELMSQPGSRQRSVYVVTLPYPNLPTSTLVVETSARVFQRTVRIGIDRPPDRNRREPYFDVRSGETWRHADEHTAGPAATAARGDHARDRDSRRSRRRGQRAVAADEGAPAPAVVPAEVLSRRSVVAAADVRSRRPSATAVRSRAACAARHGRRGNGDQCGAGSDCHTIVGRVFRVPEDILGRADRSRPRPPGAHREVDSGAGGSGGGLRFKVQGSRFKVQGSGFRGQGSGRACRYQSSA